MFTKLPTFPIQSIYFIVSIICILIFEVGISFNACHPLADFFVFLVQRHPPPTTALGTPVLWGSFVHLEPCDPSHVSLERTPLLLGHRRAISVLPELSVPAPTPPHLKHVRKVCSRKFSSNLSCLCLRRFKQRIISVKFCQIASIIGFK